MKDDKEDKPKEEEAWMAMVMDDCLMSNHLNKVTCNDFDKLEMGSDTNYSLYHDTDLPDDPFDGIDELLDDIDQAISANQERNVEPEKQIKVHLEAAYLVGTEETHSTEVDLYNSGTTRHMSGFFHQLFNYVKTDPIPIMTADK